MQSSGGNLFNNLWVVSIN